MGDPANSPFDAEILVSGACGGNWALCGGSCRPGAAAASIRRDASRTGGGSSGSESVERQLVAPYSTGKRVVHQSRKHKRIIDQENTEVLLHHFYYLHL